jgi:hypothetical protein
MPPTILHCHRNVFTELLPGNDGIHRCTCPTILLLCVLVAARTCLPSCSCQWKEGYTLSSKVRMDTHTDTQTNGRDLWICHWDGLKCHDIHTKFHKDWLRHSKVNKGVWFYSFWSVTLVDTIKIISITPSSVIKIYLYVYTPLHVSVDNYHQKANQHHKETTITWYKNTSN